MSFKVLRSKILPEAVKVARDAVDFASLTQPALYYAYYVRDRPQGPIITLIDKRN